MEGSNKRPSRIERKRAPKVHENVKQAMFIRGSKTSQTVNEILADLYMLKKPDGIQLKRKNVARPFEEATTLEFLSQKNDASLFVFGSHTKKRPTNIVIGRLFDHHILDMIEFGVEHFISVAEFDTEHRAALGNRPSLIFIGPEWEQKEEYQKFSNLLIDFFRGSEEDAVNLAGLEHVIVCSSDGGKIYFRVYRVYLKKTGTKIPRVELSEMGPSMDITIRRHSFASADLIKVASRLPRVDKPKKEKNVETTLFDTKAKIHMQTQDLSEMAVKKMRAFKKRKVEDEKKPEQQVEPQTKKTKMQEDE